MASPSHPDPSQSSTPFSPSESQSSVSHLDDGIDYELATQDETEDTITEDDEMLEEFLG